MEVESAAANPVALAEAVHRQLGLRQGPVPVREIARALDIVEIRVAPVTSFVGALVMPDDRNVGSIVVAAGLTPGRAAFTIAHELGHFLCVWHRPARPSDGFECSRADIAAGWRSEAPADRHARLEREANRFAIELLAPRSLAQRHLVGRPDLTRVVAMSEAMGLSREASARRYVELKDEPLAVVFSKDGFVRYVDSGPGFPFVSLARGDRMPLAPSPTGTDGISDTEDADPTDWLTQRPRVPLLVQTLHQCDGYAITLLSLDIDPGKGRDDG